MTKISKRSGSVRDCISVVYFSGLDIAYITNGYVYHTPNDKNKFIQPGCVQRGGKYDILKVTKFNSSSECFMIKIVYLPVNHAQLIKISPISKLQMFLSLILFTNYDIAVKMDEHQTLFRG